jgi:hypothetical protein
VRIEYRLLVGVRTVVLGSGRGESVGIQADGEKSRLDGVERVAVLVRQCEEMLSVLRITIRNCDFQ